MPNMNQPSEMFRPNTIPGIDDCDHLLTASSRKGDDTIYVHITEIEFSGKPWFYYQITVDSDSGHFAADYTGIEGPCANLKQLAHEAADYAREWFKDNRLQYAWDSEFKKLLKG